ncbi:GNAT family N-acetyltransferase [Bacillus cereus]|uniref:GNAT family N-acetyltransferase n=1 Tax=Bacillus cereus TaxID=1396 RepID=UPI0018F7825F|nr:GNAT family N-acetyltransferase [Bacillus cereus]MBJ7935853.1 GNAT family N-acetyltransferase [Bacillus cereus]
MIRKILKTELQAYFDIIKDAYPGVDYEGEHGEEFKNQINYIYDNPDYAELFGYFIKNKLVGGMILYKFDMNYLFSEIKALGLGTLAIDLLYRKRGIARELITFFLERSKEESAMALLYPFNYSYYRRIGFGLGAKIHQYEVLPKSLPSVNFKSENLTYLKKEDKQLFIECYNRFYSKKHGMLKRNKQDFKCLFSSSNEKVLVYKKDNIILGYAIFSFERAHKNNILINNIVVKELVYETPIVLKELLAFFRSLSDQIYMVILNISDDNFHYLLETPENSTKNLLPFVYHESYSTGLGIMYRIIDYKKILQTILYKNYKVYTRSFKVSLRILDIFLENECKHYLINLKNEEISIESYIGTPNYDVEIEIDTANLASVAMGEVSLENLIDYGLVSISDNDYKKEVCSLLSNDIKTVCLVGF